MWCENWYPLATFCSYAVILLAWFWYQRYPWYVYFAPWNSVEHDFCKSCVPDAEISRFYVITIILECTIDLTGFIKHTQLFIFNVKWLTCKIENIADHEHANQQEFHIMYRKSVPPPDVFLSRRLRRQFYCAIILLLLLFTRVHRCGVDPRSPHKHQRKCLGTQNRYQAPPLLCIIDFSCCIVMVFDDWIISTNVAIEACAPTMS